MEPLEPIVTNGTTINARLNTNSDTTGGVLPQIAIKAFHIFCSPCALMLIFIVVNTLWRRITSSPLSRPNMSKSHRNLQWFQTALTLCMVYILSKQTKYHDDPAVHSQIIDLDLVSSLVWSPIGSYILAATFTFLEVVQVWSTTKALFLFWCATLVSGAVTLSTKNVSDLSANALDIVHLFFVLLQCCLFLLTTLGHKRQIETQTAKQYYVHPQKGSSWISDAHLLWTFDVIWAGSKRTLEESEIPPLDKLDKCSTNIAKFERFWKIERYKKVLEKETIEREDVAKSECTDDLKEKTKHKPKMKNCNAEMEKEAEHGHVSLVRVLIHTFGLRYFILHLVKAMFELAHFVSPVLLGQFMIYVQNRDTEHWSKGVGIVLTMFIFNSFKTTFNHRLVAAIHRYQRRIRSTLILAVVRKSLTMTNESAKDLTTGEMVSFIAQDCTRITSMGSRFFLIISCPLTVVMSMYLLYVQVGEAMYVGLLIMVITLPIKKLIGKKYTDLHTRVAKSNVLQTKIINEIVNGIQVWKLYAWEPFFITKIHEEVCKEDLKINASLSVVEAAANSMFRAIPYLVRLTAFGAYLFIGGHIDAVKAFTSMHLFQMLNTPLSSLALHVPTFVEASIGLNRISKFLNGEDLSNNTSSHRQKGNSAVVIENGMFSWVRNQKQGQKLPLRNVNVSIPKGGLVAVVGMVGAGKSSLLSAILGEMELLEGEKEVVGQAAYVPQEAWVLNASVRDNILFGSKLDAQRYHEVVNACALRKDINKMRAGDQTEIGEKGINLSGGQRQRMSMARAVYNEADIYLLDDPLSAVDAHVGKHIFQKVIGSKGLLKDKTRVMVTHGIHWLPFVDSIIMIKDGEITEVGTYEELTSYNGDFVQFARQALSGTNEDTIASPTLGKVRQQVFSRLNSLNEEIISPNIKYYTENPFFKNIPQKEILDDSNSDDSDADDICGNNNNKDEYDEKAQNIKCGQYTEEETLHEGGVKKEVYLAYLRGVGYGLVASFCLLYSISMLFGIVSTYIVKQWTDDSLLRNLTLSNTDEYIQTKWQYFIQFAITGLFQVLLAFVFVVVLTKGAFRAATKLHHELLYRVLRCPMSFFNTTPSSRIICRFSHDINRVVALGGYLKDSIAHISILCTDLISFIIYCPILCITLIPIAASQYLVYVHHRGLLRQLKRFNSKHKSPMYTHFSELLNGRDSIRAYKCQDRFIKIMENKIDMFNNMDLWENLIHIVLSMRFIHLNRILELTTCLICIINGSMTAGAIGLIMMHAGIFTLSMTSFLSLMMDLELQIESLEKVIDYTNKPSEAPWEIDGENIPSDWPEKGSVAFHHFKARHQENSDLALKGINCYIEHGQKVGIVGRTGAGKTSLAMALFRLFEASDGSISIDGKNIAKLGLHTLRKRINILPQEPVIFKGSLRLNLDPFQKCTESELRRALTHAHLASFVEGLPNKLEFECEEGGKNLSMGQRQLLCLARTLLRKTKILILDEATAAVDIETDELIQKTIATEFKDCTVLTIAHRIKTVIDCDKILVLDKGLVKEFDSPEHLLKDKHSTFYSLAKESKLAK